MRGVAGVPLPRLALHSAYADSSACSTSWRAGSGRRSKRRRNGPMTGRAKKVSASASAYAAPAGVSALYSVKWNTPSSGR